MAKRAWLGRGLPLIAVAFCNACGGVGSVADAPAIPASSHMWPAAKAFGVGLGVFAGAVGSASGATYGWCDGIPTNPSQCTGEVAGKRKYTYKVSKSIALETGTGQNDGSVQMSFSASEKLGSASYLMSGTVTELRKSLRNVSGFAQVVSGAWNDTLYVSSKTLKEGTPVTIGVRLKLSPRSTIVTCDTAGNSYGALGLYSASISPPSGSEFAITGGCIGGSFEYYLYNATSKPGTVAVGTIATSVGASYPLYFSLSGNVIACQTTNYCTGTVGAKLSGDYAFTITSITNGATYTTASGNSYQ
jgi:hypothetical protein